MEVDDWDEGESEGDIQAGPDESEHESYVASNAPSGQQERPSDLPYEQSIDTESVKEEDDEGSGILLHAIRKHAREQTGTDDGTDDGTDEGPPSRKRRRRRNSEGVRLRSGRRGATHRYTRLLEEVQRETAEGIDRPMRTDPQLGSRTQLDSQLGLTLWTADEKERFFAALGRLGRDDVPGIAARVGTKCELEVRSYLLQLATARQAAAESARPLRNLPLIHIPAAAEISAACCELLEARADFLTRTEEIKEQEEGEALDGKFWAVSGDTVEEATAAANADWRSSCLGESRGASSSAGPRHEGDSDPAAQNPLLLLHGPRLLLLSERLFMNGPDPDASWRALGDGLRPGVRMDALETLRDLVVALTQRLVATALHFARARVAARDVQRQRVKRLYRTVKSDDVAAAVASLGLRPDATDFWARCPRRLQLRVYRNERAMPRLKPPRKGRDPLEEKTAREPPMTYDRIEQELGVEESEDVDDSEESEDGSDVEVTVTNADDNSEDDIVSVRSEADSDNPEAYLAQDARVTAELHEAMGYSTLAHGRAWWRVNERRSLMKRIAADVRAEDDANVSDVHQSALEEYRLWALMGEAPRPRAAPPPADTPPRRVAGEGRHFPLEEVLGSGGRWRETTAYGGEWEALVLTVQAGEGG